MTNKIVLGFCILAALVLSLSAPGVHAQDFTLAGKWAGYYYYNNGQTMVDFTLDLDVKNGRCVGQTREPNTFGDKSATHLYGIVTCRTAGTGPGQVFQFHKQYDGTGGVSHGVDYSGVISADGNTVTGQWKIGRDTGQFSITRSGP